MADSKITALTSIGTITDPAVDPLVIVDVSDTSMAATGTTKKVSLNNLLSCSPTATGAFTITGDLTVDTSTLKVDSANDRVGIGTASPSETLHIAKGSAATFLRIQDSSSSNYIGTDTGNFRVLNASVQDLIIATQAGVFTFGDGAGGTRMTLNSTGLGVGVTPSAWDSGYKAIDINAVSSYVGTATGTDIWHNARVTGSAPIYKTTAAASFYRQSAGVNYWFNAPSGTAGNAITFTQAMTLTAAGDLLVGQTTAALDANGGFYLRNSAASGGSSLIVNHRSAVTSGNSYSEFTYNGVGIGSITQNGTTGVLFNTSSDYRLKESVKPLSGGLARVNALKPSSYNWKSDGSAGEGFLAHELAEVVPFAVSGEKDAMNADGSIKSQGIDMSRIVPILVAAIKELTARVQTLEAR